MRWSCYGEGSQGRANTSFIRNCPALFLSQHSTCPLVRAGHTTSLQPVVTLGVSLHTGSQEKKKPASIEGSQHQKKSLKKRPMRFPFQNAKKQCRQFECYPTDKRFSFCTPDDASLDLLLVIADFQVVEDRYSRARKVREQGAFKGKHIFHCV